MRRPLLAVALSILAAAPLACTERVIIHKVAAGEDAEAPPPEEVDAGVEPPAVTGAIELDLGEVSLDEDITFDVPEGALGFNVVLEGRASDFDPYAPFGIERIKDPSGRSVHSQYGPVGGDRPSTYATFDVLASASVPQSEAARSPLPGGEWSVRFGQIGSGSEPSKLTAKVTVQTSGDGKFHGGELDLHVHVPTGLRVDGRLVEASRASEDPLLKERIDLFFDLTSQLLGIERGNVEFHQESSSYADLDGMAEIARGFAVSRLAKDGDQQVHMLLTNTISDQGQPIAAGIAPGIPGSANRFGRGTSGVIVTLDGGRDQAVLTMLHEVGHFIGLNHTTEFDAQSADPLSDTPRCRDLSSYDAMFSCGDRFNIMFPAGPIEGPVELSPAQTRVFRGSPVYRAFATTTMKTRSFEPAPVVLPKRVFRTSGLPLSPVEHELSFGFCGLNRLDAAGIVKRHGRDAAIAQLRAAAQDPDLAKVIRGRANLALKELGEPVN
jgi:hypothetical protein